MNRKDEILEIVKDIQDIDEQINSRNPDKEKLQKINIKAKAKFPNETSEYEKLCTAASGNPIIPINTVSIDILLSRLPLYRILYLNELRKKCADEEYV